MGALFLFFKYNACKHTHVYSFRFLCDTLRMVENVFCFDHVMVSRPFQSFPVAILA